MKFLIAFTLFLLSNTITGQNFHTEFKYGNEINNGITIQNSYPRGGQRFTTINGKEYIYVTFWTCVTNKASSDLELEIDFSANPFVIPSEPNINFKLFIPSDKMTLNKSKLPNYGLDIISFLSENINELSKLNTVIKPNSSYFFYSVIISDKGVNGPIRAGFELNNDELIYRLNNFEISCGKIVIRN